MPTLNRRLAAYSVLVDTDDACCCVSVFYFLLCLPKPDTVIIFGTCMSRTLFSRSKQQDGENKNGADTCRPSLRHLVKEQKTHRLHWHLVGSLLRDGSTRFPILAGSCAFQTNASFTSQSQYDPVDFDYAYDCGKACFSFSMESSNSTIMDGRM